MNLQKIINNYTAQSKQIQQVLQKNIFQYNNIKSIKICICKWILQNKISNKCLKDLYDIKFKVALPHFVTRGYSPNNGTFMKIF